MITIVLQKQILASEMVLDVSLLKKIIWRVQSNNNSDLPILGYSNSAANKDMMSKIWTNENTII